MIQDKTLDEALVEIMRTKRALEALRKARKVQAGGNIAHYHQTGHWSSVAEHAAAKRASLDLTRKLAELRAGK